MIHFDMPPQRSNIIKVLGFGGGGGNAVNHMFGQSIQNVDFIVCNTDAQALANSPVANKIQLGPNLTSGLGAGANPHIGKQATEESLEEIRKMLEVNTKMAFITAGMGGGTGTGGAPTVARICKELGILTVGIVTTPFSFEGPRRMAQAQAGIAELKEHVDTLLVISNDKLRHQFGNLKMKEAFAKADDVLCTAARCITDVINTHGQMNVDFSDVCTVMKGGGVAILGSAQATGENRALKAIEAAVNSPLLNDNDISGAKWILLNITSGTGENEFTMDEIDIIQNYLLHQTGAQTDIILGMGYDEALGENLGITIIATGFHHKDPFAKPEPKPEPKEEPILMTLGVAGEEKKMEVAVQAETENQVTVQPFMPVLQEFEPVIPPVNMGFPLVTERPAPLAEEDFGAAEDREIIELDMNKAADTIDFSTEIKEADISPVQVTPPPAANPSLNDLFTFLHKPVNPYQEEEEQAREQQVTPPQAAPEVSGQVSIQPTLSHVPDEEEAGIADGLTLSFMEKEEPAAQAPRQAMVIDDAYADNGTDLSEEEQQKRRAQERMARLRNLSYKNFDNMADFDDTPAYLRRGHEIHNTLANVEDFYSRATVKADENNKGTISTLNNFLHGEKPD